ncbi:hypothetical protein, partial [Bacteroides uniformis]|uniref:hypothetical protein n=1 Tax=Bacteroides uniformis TaxID=820 RepID=UPI001C37D0E6
FAKLLNKKYGTHTESRILHLHKIFYSATNWFCLCLCNRFDCRYADSKTLAQQTIFIIRL